MTRDLFTSTVSGAAAHAADWDDWDESPTLAECEADDRPSGGVSMRIKYGPNDHTCTDHPGWRVCHVCQREGKYDR